ncbi:hypothetical protein HCJ76_44020 [Streptomyces sp. MC1]|uniref:hypothetical protein n=1 Tax=Streptomyces sp. MC1 TaxID=295105 RepID=UPI0018C9E0DC|nr:hypothetical protein [Streptomyces sp. MC1]MBG7704851.1 hypothetical protein [Streptomyces sp. MC1]
MAGELKIAGAQEPEDPDVYGIRRPTSTQVGMYALALVEAANTAQGHLGAGVAVAIVASGAFVKGCVRRRR